MPRVWLAEAIEPSDEKLLPQQEPDFLSALIGDKALNKSHYCLDGFVVIRKLAFFDQLNALLDTLDAQASHCANVFWVRFHPVDIVSQFLHHRPPSSFRLGSFAVHSAPLPVSRR